jgi:hypothetical protein
VSINQKNPGRKLEKFLEVHQWERVTDRFYLETSRWQRFESGLWEKGRSRLLVDNIGVFLYRLKNGAWVRTQGLSHDLVSQEEIVFQDGSTLDLLTGELRRDDHVPR